MAWGLFFLKKADYFICLYINYGWQVFYDRTLLFLVLMSRTHKNTPIVFIENNIMMRGLNNMPGWFNFCFGCLMLLLDNRLILPPLIFFLWFFFFDYNFLHLLNMKMLVLIIFIYKHDKFCNNLREFGDTPLI